MPFLLGEHGGAVFFLLYLLALCLLSVPILIAEVVVGSYGRASPHRAMEWAASHANAESSLAVFGLAQGFLGLLVASVAALFAVWCFDRATVIHSGAMASGSPAEVASHFVSAMNDRAGQFTKALIGLAAAGALSAMGIRLGMGVLAWIVLPGVAITLLGRARVRGLTDRFATGYCLFVLLRWQSVGRRSGETGIHIGRGDIGRGARYCYGARCASPSRPSLGAFGDCRGDSRYRVFDRHRHYRLCAVI